MRVNRRRFVQAAAVGTIGGLAVRRIAAAAAGDVQHFELVQPEMFAVSGGQPSCWADFNGDGFFDQFVGFKEGVANRLYRYDGHAFANVAADLGVADTTDTRAAAWGDFADDGHLSLYVGYTRRSNQANRLYRYDGKRFVDVAHDLGVDVKGETRQVSWVDFDNDGRVDLFVAFRDAPNMLFHNDGSKFVNVAADMGVDDPRKTVGAVWFDMNDDGRLDVFTANQDGTLNGLYRNDGTRFTDVAGELGMDAAGRPATFGSNGPSVVDYDNDGRFDLFVAGYGRNFLFHNEGGGKFKEVAEAMGVLGGERATPSSWGDFDNDGHPDLYVSSYVDRPVNEHDFLYHHDGSAFSTAMPDVIRTHGATHGVVWVDFDGDGALDLSLANNNPNGGHYLFRNVMAADRARRSVQVMVVDERGRHACAGAEVRAYAPGTRKVLGGRLVDSGGGYCSQSILPVHLGLPSDGKVDIEVTRMTKAGRKVTRAANVNPNTLPKRVLLVKA